MIKMRKLLAVLLTLVMALGMLAACGGGASSEKKEEPKAEEAKEETAEAESSGETELNIMCFQGYTEDEWVKKFEEKYNCKVNATYVGGVDEMFTKAMAGGGAEYDLVSIDCGSVARYYNQDLLEPIDKSLIPNYDNLSEFFKNSDYKEIDGKLYHIPLCWGSNNVVYDKSAFDGELDSWSVLWDPAYAGRVSITDEANNNIVTTAIALGLPDPFNLSDEEFEQVKEKLTEIAKNCRTFSTGFDSEYQLLSSGETIGSISGYDSGLILKLRDEAGMDVGRVMPKEGIYAWIDGWSVLKNPAHPDLANKWMDFMLSDESQQSLASAMSFGAVTAAAKDSLDPDIVAMCSYDNIDNIDVPIFVLKDPEDVERRTELWNEIKAGL